jgi:hypothetical protein
VAPPWHDTQLTLSDLRGKPAIRLRTHPKGA